MIGEGAEVTIEGTVAEVPVLKGFAIIVCLAITSYRDPHALARLTEVGHGARVSIITFVGVGCISASAAFITGVIGAWVVVITIYGGAYADAFLTVVGNCAWVAVGALDGIKGDMFAAVQALALVFGAGVLIPTQIHIVPIYQGGFVHFPVAVIVKPVAGFLSRGECITCRKSIDCTYPLACTGAKIVDGFTGGEERGCDGLLGARANAGIGDAL